MENKKRVMFFDDCRALCMIWIVGVWHLLGYCNLSSITSTSIGICLTNGTLATFTFISGYFLGKSKVNSYNDVVIFWKKRLLRFYPLFFLSCTSLYLIHVILGYDYINSFRQYILTLVGLSVFCGDSPQTIWYISMLIAYYFITPLIIKISNLRKKISIILAIYVAFIGLYSVKLGIDTKIIILFPFYFIPIIFPEQMTKWIKKIAVPSLIVSIGLFCAILFLMSNRMNGCVLIIPSILLLVIFLNVSKLISKIESVNSFLYIVSYSSMIAYLFHRQWYGLLQFIFYRNEGFVPIWMAYAIMLPSIIIISFFSQLLYDRLVQHISEGQSKGK